MARSQDTARPEDDAQWEVILRSLQSQSERRAWRVATGACVVAALAVGAVLVMTPLHRVDNVILEVPTNGGGEIRVRQALSEEHIPMNEALDKHHLARFVRARESYEYRFLQRDHDTVLRMSTPQVYGPYGAQFDEPLDIDGKWKDQRELRVEIVSVRLTGSAASGGREAVVTYDRTLRLADRTTPPQTNRFVATVQYEYKPRLLAKEAERLDNPLGFLVTAYRTDAELAAPVAHTTGTRP